MKFYLEIHCALFPLQCWLPHTAWLAHLFIQGKHFSWGCFFCLSFFLGIATLKKLQSEKMEVRPNKGLSCDFLREKVKSTGCVSWSETGRRAASLFTQPVRRIHFLTQPTCDSHRWPPSLLSLDDFPFPLPKYNASRKTNVPQAGDISVVQRKSSLSTYVILKPREEILLLSSHSHTYINTPTQYRQVPETPKHVSSIRRHLKNKLAPSPKAYWPKCVYYFVCCFNSSSLRLQTRLGSSCKRKHSLRLVRNIHIWQRLKSFFFFPLDTAAGDT